MHSTQSSVINKSKDVKQSISVISDKAKLSETKGKLIKTKKQLDKSKSTKKEVNVKRKPKAIICEDSEEETPKVVKRAKFSSNRVENCVVKLTDIANQLNEKKPLIISSASEDDLDDVEPDTPEGVKQNSQNSEPTTSVNTDENRVQNCEAKIALNTLLNLINVEMGINQPIVSPMSPESTDSLMLKSDVIQKQDVSNIDEQVIQTEKVEARDVKLSISGAEDGQPLFEEMIQIDDHYLSNIENCESRAEFHVRSTEKQKSLFDFGITCRSTTVRKSVKPETNSMRKSTVSQQSGDKENIQYTVSRGFNQNASSQGSTYYTQRVPYDSNTINHGVGQHQTSYGNRNLGYQIQNTPRYQYPYVSPARPLMNIGFREQFQVAAPRFQGQGQFRGTRHPRPSFREYNRW
jgi:hypothetical protein